MVGDQPSAEKVFRQPLLISNLGVRMASKIVVPKLGMGTAPLTLVQWKAKEGDWVGKGSVVLVVETKRIRHDIEAEISGYLLQRAEEMYCMSQFNPRKATLENPPNSSKGQSKEENLLTFNRALPNRLC
jgi:hypothetical protein